MSAPGWRAVLSDGTLTMRPLRRRDAAAWCRVRLSNEGHLAPWEPSHPQSWQARHTRRQFLYLRRQLEEEARRGQSLPFALVWRDALVGQVSISRIVRGVHRYGEVGYWLDEGHTGRGMMTRAVAMAVDHAFSAADLHRVEVHVRPENEASLGVVRRLGLREECRHSNFLHIDGHWRDHVGFAVTTEDVPDGLLSRVPPVVA